MKRRSLNILAKGLKLTRILY